LNFDACFMLEFWLSLMIMIDNYDDYWLLLMIVCDWVLIVFDDCLWELCLLLITFDDFFYYYIFWLYILNIYFCGCKIVNFNAFLISFDSHIFQQVVSFLFGPRNDTLNGMACTTLLIHYKLLNVFLPSAHDLFFMLTKRER